jgi:hypothetical protein
VVIGTDREATEHVTDGQKGVTDLASIAAAIEREADDYWSNACGMTDADGEKFDAGWVAGMKGAAEFVRHIGGPVQ